MTHRIALVMVRRALLCVGAFSTFLITDILLAKSEQNSQGVISGNYQQAVARFEDRVKEYVKLREGLEEKLPKLPSDSSPEKIQAHKKAFEEKVRAARTGAKPGDIFDPEIANYIRTTIRRELKVKESKERKEIRETILEADTKGVPLRVNYPYPETKELTQIPPSLLLALPKLPKQVKYRFVGRHMLLVDREVEIIIDYLANALP